MYAVAGDFAAVASEASVEHDQDSYMVVQQSEEGPAAASVRLTLDVEGSSCTDMAEEEQIKPATIMLLPSSSERHVRVLYDFQGTKGKLTIAKDEMVSPFVPL